MDSGKDDRVKEARGGGRIDVRLAAVRKLEELRLIMHELACDPGDLDPVMLTVYQRKLDDLAGHLELGLPGEEFVRLCDTEGEPGAGGILRSLIGRRK